MLYNKLLVLWEIKKKLCSNCFFCWKLLIKITFSSTTLVWEGLVETKRIIQKSSLLRVISFRRYLGEEVSLSCDQGHSFVDSEWTHESLQAGWDLNCIPMFHCCWDAFLFRNLCSSKYHDEHKDDLDNGLFLKQLSVAAGSLYSEISWSDGLLTQQPS